MAGFTSAMPLHRRIAADPATLNLLMAIDGLLAAVERTPLTADTFSIARAHLDRHVEALLAEGRRDSRRAYIIGTARELLSDLQTPETAAGTGVRHTAESAFRR